jgi:hypothetical protein
MQGGIAVVTLVVAGVLLLVVGILGGGNLPILVLGLVALIAAGAFEVLAQRRG